MRLELRYNVGGKRSMVTYNHIEAVANMTNIGEIDLYKAETHPDLLTSLINIAGVRLV